LTDGEAATVQKTRLRHREKMIVAKQQQQQLLQRRRRSESLISSLIDLVIQTMQQLTRKDDQLHRQD